MSEALATLDLCIAERETRMAAFLRERKAELPRLQPTREHLCPLALAPDELEHVAWVRGLDEASVTALTRWLSEIVADVVGL